MSSASGLYSGTYRTTKRRWSERITVDGGALCHRCGEWIGPDEAWDLGHDDATGQVRGPEHAYCNRSDGARKGNALRARVSLDGEPLSTPPATTSLSPADAIDQRLAWNPDYLRQFEWLAPLADVPEDASPPLMMSPVPADAVGSYGWLAIPWIERVERKTLRWWQRLSLVRQLEHRADGSLCYRRKIESAPRRAGKSVGLRGGALWRMEHAQKPLATPFGDFTPFGEVQTVIHTGSDIAICREIQRGAWRWAEGYWGQGAVTRANGKEAIESREQDRWLVRAQDAVYGYDVCLGMVDESWNVKPDTVSEGLDPATLERCNPQVVLTSTAHRRATSLMRSELTAAMALEDAETLLLLWAAPLGSDPADPAVWRAASPHWTEDRRRLIASKYKKALAGEVDPEADDPDPMKGFEAQYLNIWRIREPRQVGRPVVDQEAWGLLVTQALDDEQRPDVVAVEGWFDDGVSVARAWDTDGGVVVSVVDVPDVVSAAALVASYRCAGVVKVGSSLAAHPAWSDVGVWVEATSEPVKAAVAGLALAIKEHAFRHARAGVLTEQALALRVADGPDGVRVVSKGRSDAVKAAVWAVREAAGAYDPMANIL